MKVYQISIGFVALVAITTLVTASPWGGEGRGQGPKSVADIEERAAKVFAMVDADSSGDISEEEFADAKPPQDRHHRGRRGPPRHMSPEGAEALHEELADKMFTAADEDGDGMLSRDEAQKLSKNREQVMRNVRFSHMDRNGDLVLTPDEFPRFGTHAREMDTDGDGEISREERRAAFDKRTPNDQAS